MQAEQHRSELSQRDQSLADLQQVRKSHRHHHHSCLQELQHAQTTSAELAAATQVSDELRHEHAQLEASMAQLKNELAEKSSVIAQKEFVPR